MELWEQAQQLHTEHKYDEAAPLYEQLLEQNGKNPGLLATLGTLYLQKQKTGLAIALLEASLVYYGSERPSDVLSNLGVAYRNAGLNDKAMALLEEAMLGDPQPGSMANYANIFIESANQEKAIKACEKAISIDPNCAMARWNISLMLLSKGEWKRGWQEHEWGMRTLGMRVDREIGGVPIWDGSPGKKVIIYGEQGMGDEIMFASMLPDVLKTNDVILECHERLGTLFGKSFPGISIYPTREEKEPQWPANETADARIAIGSLGKFYRNSKEEFPGTAYLKAEGIEKDTNKFRVGISWTGGMKAGRVKKRTVPLSWWSSILSVPNVEFVSLQYTECEEELNIVRSQGFQIRSMDDLVKHKDYYETARVVKSCDLVISVCTSVIHLAGALGVPCWIMVPKYPAWRYQNEGKNPWYRSVRQYRQPEEKSDAWLPVVQRIGLDLDDLVRSEQRILRVA